MRPVKTWGPVDGRGHAMFGWPMEEEAKLEFTITVNWRRKGVGPTVVSPAAISQLQALFLVPVLEFSPFSNSQKCVHAMCV
jgi:hypothetical protein